MFQEEGGGQKIHEVAGRRWLVFDGKQGPLLYLSLETYHKRLGKVL